MKFQCSVYIFIYFAGADARVFTLQNRCNATIWPGIQASDGQPQLMTGGLELEPLESRNLTAPKGWSGRIWGRSGCTFNFYGEGSCSTGDCGNGLYCNGASGEPPASIAEFTLDSPLDFYDVSLLEGFNMPISILAYDESGMCPSVRCETDLNQHCPKNLLVRGDRGEIVACKSACTAFQTPEHCCTAQFQNANRCRPTNYSRYFKRACPTSYTYAYDNSSLGFTCRDSNYVIVFC